MFFGQNFCEKQKFGYMNPILGQLGVTHNFDWLLIGHGWLSTCSNWTFLLSIMFPELWGKICFSSTVYIGVEFCSQILPGQRCLTSTILGIRIL